MRPDISGTLEERIEENKKAAGFDSAADFVRYCVRKEIDRREEMDNDS